MVRSSAPVPTIGAVVTRWWVRLPRLVVWWAVAVYAFAVGLTLLSLDAGADTVTVHAGR